MNRLELISAAYFVNFGELSLKKAILKMNIALLSSKNLKTTLCAETPLKQGIEMENFVAISNNIDTL